MVKERPRAEYHKACMDMMVVMQERRFSNGLKLYCVMCLAMWLCNNMTSLEEAFICLFREGLKFRDGTIAQDIKQELDA